MLGAFLKARARRRRMLGLIRHSALFDPKHYASRRPKGNVSDEAAHYHDRGWRLGLDPSRFFDVAHYLEAYPDVAQLGIDPLAHYLATGAGEMRRPSAHFDVVAFCRAHPEFDFRVVNPAELCIRKYDTYNWQDSSYHQPRLPTEVAEAFRSRFDRTFYTSHNFEALAPSEDPYAHFLDKGQYEDRDPSPELDLFHLRSQIWDRRGLAANPVHHLMKIGLSVADTLQPKGALVLDPTPKPIPATTLRLAVHVHCYHVDLLAEMLPGFENLPDDALIALTVVTTEDEIAARSLLRTVSLRQRQEIRVVPNQGRDIAPFLVGSRDLWADHDVVLHLHTKRSGHFPWGDDWRRYLYDQTIGSKGLVDAALAAFEEDPKLGCLHPRNFHRIRRLAVQDLNRDAVAEFMDGLGLRRDADGPAEYPAGSMAWYRTEALTPILEGITSLDVFEDESGQLDGTLAHVLERGMPLAVRSGGYAVRPYVTRIRQRLPR